MTKAVFPISAQLQATIATTNNQADITSPLSIPTVSESAIARAKQGLKYARDRRATQAIHNAFAAAQTQTSPSQPLINGKIRRLALRLFVRSLYQVEVENTENIPNSPAIVAANHLNYIDPFLLMAELPANPFYNGLGDARTIYGSWWKRALLKLTQGVIPLERIWKEEVAVIEAANGGRADLASLARDIELNVPKGNSIEAMRKLDRIVQNVFARGEGMVIFPEGKLGYQEGNLLPLKRGMAIYALRSGVPIVPIAIIGTKNLFFRKQITVRFGKPLYFGQSNRPKADQIETVLDTYRQAMLALLPKDYQEPQGIKLFTNQLNKLFS